MKMQHIFMYFACVFLVIVFSSIRDVTKTEHTGNRILPHNDLHLIHDGKLKTIDSKELINTVGIKCEVSFKCDEGKYVYFCLHLPGIKTYTKSKSFGL